MVDSKPSTPRKNTSNAEEQPIGSDTQLAIAILPVNNISPQTLKKLAGTPFVIDVDTGLVYLEPAILKSMKNN